MPIQCPVTHWAMMMLLGALKAKGESLGQNRTVPRFVLPGKYYATVVLKTKDKRILTCAKTTLQVQ